MHLGKRKSFLLTVIWLSVCDRPNNALSQSTNTTIDQNDTLSPNTNDGHPDEQETSRTRPDVKILQGVVKGLALTTRNNRTIFGFKGIPYGQPPIGNLRFDLKMSQLDLCYLVLSCVCNL